MLYLISLSQQRKSGVTPPKPIVEYESTWWQLGKNLLFQWEPNMEFSCRAEFNQWEFLYGFHYW